MPRARLFLYPACFCSCSTTCLHLHLSLSPTARLSLHFSVLCAFLLLTQPNEVVCDSLSFCLFCLDLSRNAVRVYATVCVYMCVAAGAVNFRCMRSFCCYICRAVSTDTATTTALDFMHKQHVIHAALLLPLSPSPPARPPLALVLNYSCLCLSRSVELLTLRVLFRVPFVLIKNYLKRFITKVLQN